MKRLSIFVVSIIMLFNLFGTTCFAASNSDIKIIINGKTTTFSPEAVVEKISTNNFQVLVPAEGLAEKLDSQINWNSEKGELFLRKDDNFVCYKLDDTKAIKNSIEETLITTAKELNGTKYVPIEFTGDALGYHVLREHSGLRIRLISKTSEYAPAIDDKPLLPGTAELESTYHRQGIPIRFAKSNDLNDLIYNKTDYSDAVKKFERGAPVIGGEVLFNQDELYTAISDKTNWANRGTKASIVPVEQNKKVSVEVFTGGTSIGKTYKTEEFLPFTEAINIEQTKVRGGIHDMDVNMKRLPEMVKEDNYLLSFYARRISGGDPATETAALHVLVGQGEGKAISKTVEFGDEWQKFEFLLTDGVGSNLVRVNCGIYKQVFQIANFEVRDLGKETDVSYYKQNKIDLVPAHMTPDAPWRKEAIERIEKVRKGDFKVTVKDKNGNPVENADLTFNMFEHEFKFGATMDVEYVYDGNNAKAWQFTENLEANFNSMSVGNGLKWSIYAQEPDRAQTVIDVAKANGIKYVRGHALWMPSSPENNYPKELYSLIDGSDTRPTAERYQDFLRIFRAHAKEMNEKFPYIYEWDVTNELLGRTWFQSLSSEKQLYSDIYKITAEEFTNGQKLMLCDNRQYVPEYWDQVDRFINDYGIKFDSFGMQGHSSIGSAAAGEGREASIPEVMEIWDRFAYEYGKTFAVTEFSLGALKPEYGWEGQGDYFRDYMIALFSHPAATGLNIWWLYDMYMDWGTIFNPRDPAYGKVGAGVSPLFGEWFIQKPGLVQYQDLVYNKWWTRNAKATTDANGLGTIRGFYGDYDVIVKVDGKKVKTEMIAFHKGYENEYTITLD